MTRTGMITMSMHEVDRLKTIQAVADGNLKPMIAATRLNLTPRQVQRLVARYRDEGAAGLISRHRGVPSNRQLPPDRADLILTIIRERYPDFGPTLACEKLLECHGLKVAKETVRRLMSDVGLWIPRKLRSAKIYQPRKRRNCVGELIQIDGSDHHWFEERGPACTLLVYIDDATSRLMHLHFTHSESTFSYFEATRRYLELHGKPQMLYSDKASVFRCNNKNAVGGDGHTQFGRVLYELNIESICANSSQAKGRVERANLTLQDRLVKELRLQGISTMAEANAFVPSFIEDFNRCFAKPPRNDFDAHRAVRHDENIDSIFTVREPRRLTRSLTLRYDKTLYLITDTQEARSAIGKYIEVYEYPDGRIEVWANGSPLNFVTYDKLPDINQGAVVENKRLGHVLQVAQLMQEQRDSRRGLGTAARTNQGKAKPAKKAAPGTKSSLMLNTEDLSSAIEKVRPKRVMTGTRG